MKKWWENGVQFECQGSGKCCVSHGEYGFVYLTPKDRIRLAQHLGMTTPQFTRQHCEKNDGYFHLIDGEDNRCIFLKDKKCSIYEARPTQCRTWPFWPEVMDAKTWKKEVATFCPGVGKGKLWSKEEIQAALDEQAATEDQL